MNMLSVVVPCYNEDASLPYFFLEIQRVADNLLVKKNLTFELLFIDDGSQDGTLNLIQKFAIKDKRVRYISFSRNFGKEAAIYAGFQHAKGDYVVLMDAELQAMLEEMYLAIKEEGYDIAAAKRISRSGEPPIRSFFSRCFYWLINKISSNAQFVDGASDFRMLSRKVVDALLTLGEYNRFSKGVFGWVGFKTKWIPYENVERVAGKTNWSFWKLFLYSLDGIVGFSTIPLAIASIMGLLFFMTAFIWMAVIIVRTIIWGDPVAGYPTLACLLLFIGGSIQLSLGVIGQYLAKTYLETKHRPIYIIAETDQEYRHEKAD